MTVFESLQTRRAVPSFDSSVAISREEIFDLIRQANLAPSSMNLQPWEFLLCHTAEDKARLQAVSFNQAKITQASAMLVVLGDLHHHEHAQRVAESYVELGYYGAERIEGVVNSAANAYADPQKQRDEAFRGGSLWAMALMLAAMGEGWDTAPMGGFEPDKLAAEFGLPDSVIPIMLIGIGKRNPAIELKPRAMRFPPEETVHEGRY